MELTTPEYTVKDYLQLSKAVNAVEEGAWSESALRKAREALMSEPVSDRRDENIAQIDRGYEDIDGRLNALGARIERQ